MWLCYLSRDDILLLASCKVYEHSFSYCTVKLESTLILSTKEESFKFYSPGLIQILSFHRGAAFFQFIAWYCKIARIFLIGLSFSWSQLCILIGSGSFLPNHCCSIERNWLQEKMLLMDGGILFFRLLAMRYFLLKRWGGNNAFEWNSAIRGMLMWWGCTRAYALSLHLNMW